MTRRFTVWVGASCYAGRVSCPAFLCRLDVLKRPVFFPCLGAISIICVFGTVYIIVSSHCIHIVSVFSHLKEIHVCIELYIERETESPRGWLYLFN